MKKILLDALKLAGEDFEESFTVADLHEEDYKLVYVNEVFTKTTGYSRAQAIGYNCRFLQGELSDRETTLSIRESIKNQASCFYDVVNYKLNGEKFWNRLLLIPIGINENDIRYIVGIQMDVTEKHQSFEDKVPHACFSPENNHIKDKLEEVVKYYRSFKYFEGTDPDSSHSIRIQELAQKSRDNLKEICHSVRSL